MNSSSAAKQGLELAGRLKEYQDRKKAAEERVSKTSAAKKTTADDETSTSTSGSSSSLSSSWNAPRSFFGRSKAKAPKSTPDIMKPLNTAPESALPRKESVSKVAVPPPQAKKQAASASAIMQSSNMASSGGAVSSSGKATSKVAVPPPQAKKLAGAEDLKTIQVQKTLTLMTEMIATQEEREVQVEKDIVNLLQEAKIKNASGNQRGALRLLKKRKMKQKEQDKISRAIETMEAQVFTIESALENAKVVRVMQQGANAVKTLRDDKTYGLTVDAVEEALADIRDTMEYAEEIQQILAEPIGAIDLDDDELLKELQGTDDTLLQCSPKTVSAPRDAMPDVPTQSPGKMGGEQAHKKGGKREEERKRRKAVAMFSKN